MGGQLRQVNVCVANIQTISSIFKFLVAPKCIKKIIAQLKNTYRRVLSLDPKNKRVHYYLARNYLHKKDYTNAENEMRIYLDMKIDSIQRGWANHYLGHILRRQKRYDEAYKMFKSILANEKQAVEKVDGKNEGKKEVTA